MEIYYATKTLDGFVSDTQKIFEDTYCNCTDKYKLPDWCIKKSWRIKKPYCILNGGLKSEFCPGAIRFEISRKRVDDYYSYHPSVCDKAARKW